ncbi:MAG: hypothetical protein K9M07_03390 [Simkaniaceae bacterium]|nr:hypothetical protein [Simkaniaceae bacterium]
MFIIKWLVKTFFALCFLILILLCFLPTILSSEWGKDQLSSLLSVSTHSTIKIDSLQLGWFKPQKVKNLTVASSEMDLSIRSIEINNTLWQFIWNGFAFNHLSIEEPKARFLQLMNKPTHPASYQPLALIQHLSIQNGLLSLVSNHKTTLQINAIDLNLSLDRKQKSAMCDLSCETAYHELKGNVALSAMFVDHPSLPQFKMKTQVSDLPLQGLDELAHFLGLYTDPILTESIGSTMNMKIDLDSTRDHLEADIHSKFLNLSLHTPNHSPPLIFDWTVSPSFVELFGIKIKHPFSLSTSVEELYLPSLLSWKKMRFKMNTTLSQLNWRDILIDRGAFTFTSSGLENDLSLVGSLDFSSPNLGGKLSLNGVFQELFSSPKVQFDIDSNRLNIREPFTQINRIINQLHCRIANQTAPMIHMELSMADIDRPSLLGNSCKANFQSHFILDKKQASLIASDLVLSSHLLSGHFLGDVHFSSQAIHLSKDGFIDYKMTPQVFKLLMQQFPFPIDLKKETSISFILEKNSSLDRLDANIFSEDFTIALSNSRQDFDFQNIDSQIKYQTKTQMLEAIGQMKVKKEGALSFIGKYSLLNHLMAVDLKGDKIPSDLFSPWFQLNAPLSKLIGPTLNATTYCEIDSHLRSLRFDLTSQYLSFKGAASFNSEGNLSALTAPIDLNWSLSPEAYLALSNARYQRPSLFQLQAPAQIGLQVNKFSIDPGQEFNSAELKGNVSIDHFKVANHEAQAEIETLKCDFKKKKNESIFGRLSGSIASYQMRSQIDGSIEMNHIDLHLPLSKLLLGMHINTHFNVEQLPTVIIDAMTQPFLAFPISSLLGESLNANVDIDMKEAMKRLAIDIDSTDSLLNINGLIANQTFVLTDPIHGSLKLTPKLSALLFESLGFTVIKSRLPITLDISDKGFILPLSENLLYQTQIPRMILDPGQIVAINTGTVGLVNGIFKVDSPNSLQMWFAPLYMRMNQGVLSIERTEILLDKRYHICIWGTVDMIRQQVNLIVGLTAQSLKETLGINKLPASYVLQIPLEGPFGNVKLKTGVATAKIALLIGTKIPSNTIFGGLTQTLNQIMNDQSRVPPPKRPYPWERQIGKKESEKIELKHQDPQETVLFNLPISLGEPE